MKRILIIDESEIVRETLALILGREFAVSKRTLGAQGLSFCRQPGRRRLVDSRRIAAAWAWRPQASRASLLNCHLRCSFWLIRKPRHEGFLRSLRSTVLLNRSIPTSCTRRSGNCWRAGRLPSVRDRSRTILGVFRAIWNFLT